MNANFDAIIFDLDGTLWDSTQPVTYAWNRALENLGMGEKGITEKDVESIMGLPQEKIFQKIFPQEKGEVREAIAKECRQEELPVLRSQGGILYPGVEKGLQVLAQKFPLFIVSNCQGPYLSAFFECTGFRTLFKDSECHGHTLKTKAENIKLVMKRNAIANAAYIGDTAGDESAAHQAGATYFHVDYGFGSPVRDCLRFRTFDELVRFFISPTEK